jgi:hypothetical protein
VVAWPATVQIILENYTETSFVESPFDVFSKGVHSPVTDAGDKHRRFRLATRQAENLTEQV